MLPYSVKTRQILRGLFCTLILTFCSVGSPLPAYAKYASIVIDATSGKILYQKNSETRNYPASLTKMMSLYMIFDEIKAGRASLTSKLKISKRAARQPASRLGLRYGQTISIHDAILALVTKSANDVATSIAEHISGSERTFALKMTAKARELGMKRTTFRNASGLPNRGQLSTAKDMAKLARALLRDHPNFYSYFSVKKFSFNGRKHKNHNKLLTTYKGADGIKTGYIRASGYNLVASVKRRNTRLIGVVFGGNSSRHRNKHMTHLLNKGFRILDKKQRYKPKIKNTLKPKRTITARGKQRIWGVQVGAFNHYPQAYRAAKLATKSAQKFLKSGAIKIVSLKKKNGRSLFKARINGITKRQAYQTCALLKKIKQHCMERILKSSLQLASK